MKSEFCIGLLAVLTMLCFAQTPKLNAPIDEVDPYPAPPDRYPESYQPPPMELIPEGEYEMGDHLRSGTYDELPVHAVYIDAFYMDNFEVTNIEYCTYLNSVYGLGLIEIYEGVVYSKTGYSRLYCDTTISSSFSRITWNGRTFGITTCFLYAACGHRDPEGWR